MKPLLKFQHRYVVWYSDDEGNHKTFATWAALASIATARVTGWLDEHKPEWASDPYYLLPRIDLKKEVNFEI
jgi:hypothetical protein